MFTLAGLGNGGGESENGALSVKSRRINLSH